jgi:hypothetical protein
MRIGKIVLLLVVCIAGAACDRLGSGEGETASPTEPSGPPAAGAAINATSAIAFSALKSSKR